MNRIAFWVLAISLAVLIGVVGRQFLPSRGGGGPVAVQATGGSVAGGTAVPAPAIGGPFALTDHTGAAVTDQTYRGKYMLVYFGYTFCPDVCPTSLTAIGDALDAVGPDVASRIVTLFITVDPERDTIEYMRDYVKHFHPGIVGLAGTKEQVVAAAKAYRVYFAKVQEEGSAPGDYLMDHTAITYLMGPDGAFITHFGHGTKADAIAARLREVVR